MDEKKPTTYPMDSTPLLVGYNGLSGSICHIPPVGPRVRVGTLKLGKETLKGVATGGKYVFHKVQTDRFGTPIKGMPTPVWNPEHKAWYKKMIDSNEPSWLELRPDGTPVKAKTAPVPGVPMETPCPGDDCYKSRADFGKEGPEGDEVYRRHVGAHYETRVQKAEAQELRHKAQEADKKGLLDRVKEALASKPVAPSTGPISEAPKDAPKAEAAKQPPKPPATPKGSRKKKEV